MTRWVRSGNSQKHKKMPGNATKWGEFDNQRLSEISSKKKKHKENYKQDSSSLIHSVSSVKINSSFEEKFSKKKEYCASFEMKSSNKINELRNNLSNDSYNNVMFSNKKKNIKLDISPNKINNAEIASIQKIGRFHKKQKNKKVKKQSYTVISSEISSLNTNIEPALTDVCELKKIDKCVDSAKGTNSPKKQKKIKIKQNNMGVNSEYLSLAKKNVGTTSIETFQMNKKNKLGNNHFDEVDNEICLQIKQNHDDSEKEVNGPKKQIFQQYNMPFKKQKKRKKQNNMGSNSLNLSVDPEVKELFTTEICEEEMCLTNNTSCEIGTNDFSNLKSGIKNNSLDVLNGPQRSHKFFKKQKDKKIKENKVRDDFKNLSTVENTQNSPPKVSDNKKKYLKKLQKKRENLGILLLPTKIERKLYNIRRRLKEKGFPPEMQKQIMRKERRKEELKFRMIVNPSKLCFHCREAGHVFANCPKKVDSLKQETGICFKCGSIEHTSFKCPEKVQGFPFAKCFICKEQGHITRDCQKNKHGVYPKGGKCNVCGNVNHLKKDCPSLKKKGENEETNITLHTISENTSIDAEVIEKEEKKQKPRKKIKIVTF